ncbi:uncharacterized protein ARMOST_06663 [Armillaria ostoyae]|uniref:Uncharacterized protein n=1 Tax=Armillaria ostoyae TaxID=47428 RepID=A0A284R3K7_ARMOS|nr:uncharacterized protein ARMOST_06663 [Armillaria ostoyae]
MSKNLIFCYYEVQRVLVLSSRFCSALSNRSTIDDCCKLYRSIAKLWDICRHRRSNVDGKRTAATKYSGSRTRLYGACFPCSICVKPG